MPPLYSILATAAVTLVCALHPALASAESRSIRVRGVKIHYLVEGRGDPVVLIHGLHSSAQMNWGLNGIIADLAKDHLVIAPDLPGHGRSDKPADERAYGKQLVSDIVAILDDMKIDRADIVGYSLGGMIAVKMMVLHPERVRSAVVGGMGWLREGSRLQHTWEQMPSRSARTPVEFVHTMGKLAVSEQELKKITVPVEVIVGDKDPVRRLYVAPLRDARPDWKVVEIPDSGHITCVTRPQFREEIGAWLRQRK